MFLKKLTRCLVFFAGLLILQEPAWAEESSGRLSLEADIAIKGAGCGLTVPTSVLQFRPLQASQLKGAVQTYQILPLPIKLHCEDEREAVTPVMTIEGETPYVEHDNVFLNAPSNGVGFMVRQSPKDAPISQADFYQPAAAIGNRGAGTRLTILNADNQYSHEQILWVGLVGPFQTDIVPGRFQASLTLNVAFE